MSEEAVSSKMLSLKSGNGEIFEVSPEIAKEMKTVQSFIEDADPSTASSAIPLPNVHSRELSRIIDYCNYHQRFRADKPADDNTSAPRKSFRSDEEKEYDAGFVKDLSHDQLQELILAANYLNVKDLLDFLSQTVADIIQNKSVEYVRKFFGIVSDFTPEEEAKIREEHAWAFEGVDED